MVSQILLKLLLGRARKSFEYGLLPEEAREDLKAFIAEREIDFGHHIAVCIAKAELREGMAENVGTGLKTGKIGKGRRSNTARLFDRTLEVIAQIDKAETPQGLCTALTDFTSRYGLTGMIAGTMPARDDRKAAQREHLLACGFPREWMEHYLACNYAQIDPIIARIKSDMTPFEWSEVCDRSTGDLSDKQRLLLSEAGDFKLKTGFAVPMVTVEGDIMAVSFGGERSEMPPESRGIVSLVSCFAIGRAIELRTRTQDRGNVHLTPREIECLKWIADGKSEWEIGCILGISEDTADRYLASAHMKLCARSRPQAVANAIRLGFFS